MRRVHHPRWVSGLFLLFSAVLLGCQPLAAGQSGQGRLLVQLPAWCGGYGSGGPAPPPGQTSRPLATQDPHHLLCLAAINRSKVNMATIETERGIQSSWGLVEACAGIDFSGAIDQEWILAGIMPPASNRATAGSPTMRSGQRRAAF